MQQCLKLNEGRQFVHHFVLTGEDDKFDYPHAYYHKCHYSAHSNATELEEFVKQLRPKKLKFLIPEEKVPLHNKLFKDKIKSYCDAESIHFGLTAAGESKAIKDGKEIADIVNGAREQEVVDGQESLKGVKATDIIDSQVYDPEKEYEKEFHKAVVQGVDPRGKPRNREEFISAERQNYQFRTIGAFFNEKMLPREIKTKEEIDEARQQEWDYELDEAQSKMKKVGIKERLEWRGRRAGSQASRGRGRGAPSGNSGGGSHRGNSSQKRGGSKSRRHMTPSKGQKARGRGGGRRGRGSKSGKRSMSGPKRKVMANQRQRERSFKK